MTVHKKKGHKSKGQHLTSIFHSLIDCSSFIASRDGGKATATSTENRKQRRQKPYDKDHHGKKQDHQKDTSTEKVVGMEENRILIPGEGECTICSDSYQTLS